MHEAEPPVFALQQERFLNETGTAVFLYVLQDGEVHAMNSFPHLHRLGFLLSAEEIHAFHVHEFAEILVLVKGYLLHEVNGSHQILPPGSLVFVRPYDLHRLLPVNSERTLFASLVLSSDVVRALLAFLASPESAHLFNTAPSAPSFQLQPDETRSLMLQMESVSNEQARSPETAALLGRALAAQLFAGYLLNPRTREHAAPAPPAWLAKLRDEAEGWDSLRHAPRRLHTRCACHPSHLCKCFRRYYGETPTDFLNRLRLRKAVRALAEPDAKVAAVAADLGFASLSHFHRLFKRQYGLTPAAYSRSKTLPGA